MDDDSIAQSYNQKVKNDTNYLGRNREPSDENSNQNDDSFNYKKEKEILYNL